MLHTKCPGVLQSQRVSRALRLGSEGGRRSCKLACCGMRRSTDWAIFLSCTAKPLPRRLDGSPALDVDAADERQWTQVVGRLADKPPAEGQPLAGLLVRHGYADSLMHPADLPLFTKLRPGRVLQRQAVACSAPFSEVTLEETRPLCAAIASACGAHIRVHSSLIRDSKQAGEGVIIMRTTVFDERSPVRHPSTCPSPSLSPTSLRCMMQNETVSLLAQVRFALENVFEGVHGAGELGGVAGDGTGAAIRIADQVCSRPPPAGCCSDRCCLLKLCNCAGGAESKRSDAVNFCPVTLSADADTTSLSNNADAETSRTLWCGESCELRMDCRAER